MNCEIWCEGFIATGERGTATYVGESSGLDFIDACKNYANRHKHFNNYFKLVDSIPKYWGCRLFDNEVDARKGFG